MPSTPIAIVGQACVLPGALTPEALWANVVEGRSAVSRAPAGRWRLDAGRVVAADAGADHAFTDRGGYVTGFDDVWDPEGFALPAGSLRALDPLFQWVLHAGREALRPVRGALALAPRTGLVLGNLSYPTSSAGLFAEATWIERQGEALLGGALAAEVGGLPVPGVDPRNRHSSGLPAHLTAAALGLGGRAFALDAACASGLYALRLACRALARGDADLMLAGAVNRADDLFLHIGFTALAALSRTGRSRPFHAGADGLLPAEGAVVIALRRLDDARRDGDAILGVVRAVGVSNDGRGRGALTPSSEGQERAMRAAYAEAEIAPADVSLVECHATGTQVGDATEVESMAAVFTGLRGVPIGSLKSNLGHLITAAGLAGVVKVLGAFRAGVRPPTLHVDEPAPSIAGTPFRLLAAAEPWTGPRRAAVSAFGFGGNNAHALIEAPEEAARLPASAPRRPSGDVAIVAVAAQIGDASSPAEILRARTAGGGALSARRTRPLRVAYRDLATSPRELAEALPQQLAALVLARDAAAQLAGALPRDRTAVFVGMGCDPAIPRWGARWRLPEWSRRWGAALGAPVDPAWIDEAASRFAPALTAAAVIGTMPNMPANRINRALDLGGPGFTVASEEISGLTAVELACDALRAGEVDAALAGAVDFASDPVHEAASAALGRTGAGSDAAAVWILKRVEDAARDGDHVWAVVSGDPHLPLLKGEGGRGGEVCGNAAHALVDATVRMLSARGEERLSLRYEAMLGQSGSLILRAPDPPAVLPEAGALPGDVVEVPAHMPDVRLEPIRIREPQSVDGTAPSASTLPPAPPLPRDVEDLEIAPAPPAAATPAVAPLPLPRTAAAASMRAALLERASRRLERVQEIHVEHLDAQRRLYADLARITETATVLLAGGRAPYPPTPLSPLSGGKGEPEPETSPPAPLPPEMGGRGLGG